MNNSNNNEIDLVRKNRAYKDKLLLIDIISNTDKIQAEIVGTTGNIYDIEIKDNITCNCPDYKTRNRYCKHIYFVIERILKLQSDAPINYNDVKQIIDNKLNLDDKITASNTIKSVYFSIKNKPNKIITQRNEQDDLCPICLDLLNDGDELDYCKYSCGKSVHKNCFTIWSTKKSDICVYCRTKWSIPTYINVINK